VDMQVGDERHGVIIAWSERRRNRFCVEAPCSKGQGIFDPQGGYLCTNRHSWIQKSRGLLVSLRVLLGTQ
jgi:hypothetical protein